MDKKLLKISMIISTIVFIIAMIAIPVRISNKKAEDDYNRQQELLWEERQDFIDFINSQSNNNQYKVSNTQDGIYFEFTVSHGSYGNQGAYVDYDFQITCKKVENNVEYYSYIWFDYNEFENARYFSKVTLDTNKSYTFEYKGISLLDCPNISTPTKIERYTTSNWDYSNDINDYKSASFGVLRAGITLTQQKAQAYNNNLSLW